MPVQAIAVEGGYPVSVVIPPNWSRVEISGLCAHCRFVRQVKSDRGATFLLCQRSMTDPSFPKYPRQPVLECRGYEHREGSEESAE